MSTLVERLRQAGCVFPEEEAALICARFSSPSQRGAAVQKRRAGTPLELVLGEVEFAGTTVVVRPRVFLPRRRAEVLVDLAAAFAPAPGLAPHSDRRVTALDLGCGTGAIAAALCDRHPDWSVHAVDVDSAAVSCAKINAEQFGFAVHQGDWFDGLPAHLRGRFDLIVAHLPYVPTRELVLLPRDYRAAEPLAALDGGPDGLDPWRAVARVSREWLAPGGHVLVQVSARQRAAAAALAYLAGLAAEILEYDDSVVLAASSAGSPP